MKLKFKQAYMDTAKRFAQLSTATKLKVGAVIVKDDIMIFGYNGTPAGWDNNCEAKVYMPIDAGGWLDPEEIETQWPYADENGRYKLKTKPEVLHAEANAIAKLAKGNVAGVNASIYITHAPCLDCAKLIYQSGITEVYYDAEYTYIDGIAFLEKCGITVQKLVDNNSN